MTQLPQLSFSSSEGAAGSSESRRHPSTDGFGDAARVLAVDDLVQPRDDMRMAVLAELDHDPAAAHLVRDGAGGAGAGEGIENEIAGVGSDCENALKQRSGLGVSNDVLLAETAPYISFFCFVGVCPLRRVATMSDGTRPSFTSDRYLLNALATIPVLARNRFGLSARSFSNCSFGRIASNYPSAADHISSRRMS